MESMELATAGELPKLFCWSLSCTLPSLGSWPSAEKTPQKNTILNGQLAADLLANTCWQRVPDAKSGFRLPKIVMRSLFPFCARVPYHKEASKIIYALLDRNCWVNMAKSFVGRSCQFINILNLLIIDVCAGRMHKTACKCIMCVKSNWG